MKLPFNLSGSGRGHDGAPGPPGPPGPPGTASVNDIISLLQSESDTPLRETFMFHSGFSCFVQKVKI